jgi:hypothetical protein
VGFVLLIFFVGVRVTYIFCGDSCCSIYFVWGFVLLNLSFVGIRVAQFIFCGGSCYYSKQSFALSP